MNITLLSDTHGHIDDRILRHVEGSDEVWHAGDIGDLRVTDALAEVAPCRAVFGNIDDHTARRTWPEHARFRVGGLNVWMTHIGGRPPRYAKGVLPSLRADHPIFLFVVTVTFCLSKKSLLGADSTSTLERPAFLDFTRCAPC